MYRSHTAIFSVIFTSAVAASAQAALVSTQYESAIPAVYANGGGGGFGGTLGNGAISMDVVGTDLVVSFTPGNALNDNVALFLDSRSGGFVDSQMDDQADGGRRGLSNLTSTDDDLYPSGVLPDFGVIFGNFGTVVFKLTAGNTPGHLNFVSFTGTVGSTSIPLATLGSPAQVDFFAGYVADSGYNSNESLPASLPLNGAGNPGFGDGSVHTYDNFNRFVTTPVPEPSSLVLASLLLMTFGVIRKRRR